MSQEREVSRKEWIKGSGVWIVTTERPAWKIVCGGTAIGSEIGPYETEEEAKEAQKTLHVSSLVGQYVHRSSHYERNGKRVE